MAKQKAQEQSGYSVPRKLFDKEFLRQFHTREDVGGFMNEFHAHLYEQLLAGELDAHLGYEKNDKPGDNSGNSRNGSYSKKIQTLHEEADIRMLRDRNREFKFEPLIIPKHERGTCSGPWSAINSSLK